MSTITISMLQPISPLSPQISVLNYVPDPTQIITLTAEPLSDPADEPLFGTHLREAARAIEALVR